MKKLLTPTTQYGEIRTIVSRSFWLRAQLIEKYRFRNLFNAIVTPAGGAGYKAWEVVEGRQRNDFKDLSNDRGDNLSDDRGVVLGDRGDLT